MGKLSIITSVKGNRTNRTKKKGETKMYNNYCNREENNLYKKGTNVSCYSEIDGLPVLSAWELCPDNGRKSFYGKARYLVTEKGWYLLSYDTIVCGVFPNDKTGEMNVLKRYWMDYSTTTAKHINAFLHNSNLRGLSKKEWESLKYNMPYIIDNVS